MIIKRDIYLNKLIDSMNNGLIKVITGIRRCGKSFLLFNLFDELKDYEEHTSILVEGNEYKKEKTSRGDNKSHLDIINELLSK